jgi:hypothetical protein
MIISLIFKLVCSMQLCVEFGLRRRCDDEVCSALIMHHASGYRFEFDLWSLFSVYIMK